ncbi:hypothetical protein NQ314_015922, partial [Rhamnusium bicolor]
IFRHGERTVDPTTLYPTDPYINEKYYPYGVGQLTNVKLVLAGLFPPVGDQIFEPGLYWQPIPYNFLPRNQDKLLLGILCPNYKKFYARLTKSKKLQKDYYENRDLFKYLSVNSGWNISDYNDIFYLYFGLRSEKEWGFELPEWTNMVYPQPLEDLINILLIKKSRFIKSILMSVSGYHLQKIIEDTKAKITGALKPSKRKIFLYSCHESNIANFLTTLDVFEPQIPPYGCYILVEVHKIEGVYGIKIYYQDYIGDGPKLLKLPACDAFCPLDKFIALTEEYIPAIDSCGRDE